jgi:hypothetical protein
MHISYLDGSEYDKLRLILRTENVHLGHSDFCLDDTKKKTKSHNLYTTYQKFITQLRTLIIL